VTAVSAVLAHFEILRVPK